MLLTCFCCYFQPALWDFEGSDVYQSVPVDTLHQDFNGITVHLFECLKAYMQDHCGPSVPTIVRDRLAKYRNLYLGSRIPKDSIWQEKVCGEVCQMHSFHSGQCVFVVLTRGSCMATGKGGYHAFPFYSSLRTSNRRHTRPHPDLLFRCLPATVLFYCSR